MEWHYVYCSGLQNDGGVMIGGKDRWSGVMYRSGLQESMEVGSKVWEIYT